jgi:hypothetical protein
VRLANETMRVGTTASTLAIAPEGEGPRLIEFLKAYGVFLGGVDELRGLGRRLLRPYSTR